MPEVTYNSVTWTAGDILTEAKLDNMVANDRAVDAMAEGIEFLERTDPSTPASNKIHLYAKDKAGVPTLYIINDTGAIVEIADNRPTFLFTITGTLTTSNSLTPIIPAHKTLTIVRAFGVVKTAPTDADILIDIIKNGTSIWASTPNNRLKIANGATSGSQTDFDTTGLVQDDSLVLDIDQIGSTVAGADLSVTLRCE